MSIREIAQNFHNFCPKYMYIPPLSEFSHCFCPNFPSLLPEFPIAFARIWGKSNGKFGQEQWEIQAKAIGNSGKSNWKIWAKAMRKLGKRRHIFRAKIIAFARLSHCFFPNFPLLLPEFSIAFSRISHCFCLNYPLLLPEFPTAFIRIFRFHFFLGGGGGTVPPCLLRLCTHTNDGY